MKIGVMINVVKGINFLERFQAIRDMDMGHCQLSIWDMPLYNDETAAEIIAAREATGIEISTLWAGYRGKVEWNFMAGPFTAGLVPPAYRAMREEDLIAASVFAEKIGVTQIATHVGFLPENYYDPDFWGTVASLRRICKEMGKRGQTFLFETGQETPVTVLRAIEEIGCDNVGVNLDTANVILYGKGNPADAILVFGKYVRDLHIKDGFYPTNGKYLGEEVAAGEGLANFPLILKRLKDIGYDGYYTIEREISGDQQIADIVKARDLLRDIEKTLA